jgi:hypothetical protein
MGALTAPMRLSIAGQLTGPADARIDVGKQLGTKAFNAATPTAARTRT